MEVPVQPVPETVAEPAAAPEPNVSALEATIFPAELITAIVPVPDNGPGDEINPLQDNGLDDQIDPLEGVHEQEEGGEEEDLDGEELETGDESDDDKDF